MEETDTLLVVDDGKVNRDMLARRLTREGYSVLTAGSGREALDIVAGQPVSLILLDLMMPEMNGLQVLEELRKTHGDLELPVLMVSANTDSPQMVSAIDVGANDYLTKPVDFDLLVAKVKRHLKLRSGSGSGSRVRSGGSIVSVLPPSAEAKTIVPPPRPAAVAAADFTPPKPGESLGHYQLDQLLGEGGMGQVFLAQDTRLLRKVAIKVMIGEALPKESLDRFLLEARAVARVSHPGVVTIFEVATDPRYFIAMELIKGQPLQQVTDGKPLQVKRAVHIMRQVLDALSVVHEAGVIHRDLKPANVMVLANDRVKVLDFGLAKMEGQDLKLTRTGQVWGTPQYMSPEQIDPEFGAVDGQTDLFAAASILYEMLTGQPPFTGKSLSKLIFEILSKEPISPTKLNPEVSPELSEALLVGLRKEKKDRYPSCAAFYQALAQFD